MTRLIHLFLLWSAAACLWTRPAASETWEQFTSMKFIMDIGRSGEYIWCGTDGGVFRYDRRNNSAYRWTNLNGLAGNNVGKVLGASDGTVWLITNGGACRWDGTSWTTHYQAADGFKLGNTQVLYEDWTGTLWFGIRQAGVVSFDGETWQVYDEGDGLPVAWDAARNRNFPIEIYALFRDGAGRMWVGTNGGIASFDGQSWTTYGAASGLPEGNVNSITEDHAGNIWCCSFTGCWLAWWDGVSWQKLRYYVNQPSSLIFDQDDVLWFLCEGAVCTFENTYVQKIKYGWYSRLFRDSRGNFWAVDTNWGSACSMFDGTAWHEYTVAKDSYPILSYEVDEHGVVWAGTFGDGLFRMEQDGIWLPCDERSRFPFNYVRRLAIDGDDHVWCWPTDQPDSAAFYNGIKWTTRSAVDVPAELNETDLIGPDGVPWRMQQYFQSPMVERFDGSSWVAFCPVDSTKLKGRVRAMYRDGDGKFWLGATNGVARYDSAGWEYFLSGEQFPEQSNGSLYVSAIIQDKAGVLWFGWMGGITSCDGVSLTTISTSELCGRRDLITCAAIDSAGRRWFGTRFCGALVHDGLDLRRITGNDGLTAEGINDIQVDSDGSIWFATQAGVAVLRDYFPSGVAEYGTVPEEIMLSAPFPNPFNPSVTIAFTLPEACHATLSVYAATGQRIATLLDGFLGAGAHAAVFDGDNLPSGLYFARLEAGGRAETRKMLLVR